jgi:hypothetical protein
VFIGGIMKCKTIQKNLAAFIDKELPTKSNDVIKDHLDYCKNCRNVLKGINKVNDLLNTPIELPADPYFKTRLKTRINADSKIPVRKRLLPFLVPGYIVVGLLFGALLGINAGRAVMQPPQTNVNYAEYYSSSDIFNSYPKGSLADSYALYNQPENIN